MSVVNPTPFFLWSGIALVVLDHHGLTAAGVTLAVLGLVSHILTGIDK